MSEPSSTPEDRTESRPWPERLIRVAVFVLPLMVALSAGLAVWAHSRAGKGGALDLSTIEYVARPVVDQRPAPNFSVRSLRGSGRVSLRQYEGRIVVVNLWASWCGPCRKEAPALEQVWKQYREGGAMFIGIDHQDTKTDGLAFAREFGLTYPLGFDPDGTVARAFGALGVPTTYVIAPNGWIAYRFLGRVQPADLIRVLHSLQPTG
jgi:DsbE subfamily thiol:disulfide oxidoreductase